MTNAIEQTKREMYDWLAKMKNSISMRLAPNYSIEMFEPALEAHLEELRKALVAGNAVIVECAQHSAESFVELERRLADMKNERDAIQLRLHAVDHAYKTQQDLIATPMQEPGDRGASEQADGKTVDVLACAVTECQLIVTSWAVNGLRAKKAIRAVSAIVNGSPKVLQAMQDFEKADPGVCGYCDGLGYIHCNGGRPTAPCPSGCQ